MTADTGEPGGPGGKRPAKPRLDVPPELMAQLRKDVLANRLFERMSPARRREYIRWVADPARETTRISRAEKAIALILDKDDAPSGR